MPSPTQRLGAELEMLAEKALARAGYAIEARNWRGAGSEIDRIAWDGDVLVFVEIRARSSENHGSGADTVRGEKQRRVARGALAYIAGLSPLPDCRFDVVSITGGRVEIIKDAFELEARGRAVPMI